MKTPFDIIKAKRADIVERERAIELEKAELAGMEMMANLFGAPKRAASNRVVIEGSGATKPSRGRQSGAISKRWRAVLEYAILAEPEWLSPEDFVPIIKLLEGRDVTAPQVRRILEGYTNHGFVEQNIERKFRVTDIAREKFGLKESGARVATNENGPPTDKSEDGPEIAHSAQ